MRQLADAHRVLLERLGRPVVVDDVDDEALVAAWTALRHALARNPLEEASA